MGDEKKNNDDQRRHLTAEQIERMRAEWDTDRPRFIDENFDQARAELWLANLAIGSVAQRLVDDGQPITEQAIEDCMVEFEELTGEADRIPFDEPYIRRLLQDFYDRFNQEKNN